MFCFVSLVLDGMCGLVVCLSRVAPKWKTTMSVARFLSLNFGRGVFLQSRPTNQVSRPRNIIPSSTGAAKAVGKVIPAVKARCRGQLERPKGAQPFREEAPKIRASGILGLLGAPFDSWGKRQTIGGSITHVLRLLQLQF